MRNTLVGLAALAVSCASTNENVQPTAIDEGNPFLRRDSDGCSEGSSVVEAPINPEFPRLTARACLDKSFSSDIDDLRAKCKQHGLDVIIHNIDAPHWECGK